MRFYEELGVPDDASPDAIKDAYRMLARLLHPDQQTDPALKDAAERQMRRLNRVYGVLSDPERRRRYDREQHEGERQPIIIHAPPPVVRRGIAWQTLLWPTLAIACGALVIWVATREDSSNGRDAIFNTTRNDTQVNLAKLARSEDAHTVTALREQLQQVTRQRDVLEAQLARAYGRPVPRTVAPAASVEAPVAASAMIPPPPANTLTETPVHESRAVTPAAAETTPRPIVEEQAAPAPRFSGAWFYASSGIPNKNPALYPPEFIEAMITETGGSMYGRYRARYQIVDRAISPDVVFQFEGKPEGQNANLTWVGQGGARGYIHLKMVGENAMEVRWSASQLGSMGLSSGTAVLKRRRE